MSFSPGAAPHGHDGLADGAARERALSVFASFCVSAPAGSGKTGLLVLRFLALLARSAAPESVVAITFTRKAAAEMRARILQALEQASSAAVDTQNPGSAHDQQRRELAARVLAQDERLGWGLVSNPARLRIQTIDSFCAELSRQMPVLSGSGGALQASDDSAGLYQRAVEAFLERELASNDLQRREDLEQLLLHLDNNWETATELLARLLARREQWQPVFGGRGLDGAARQDMRAALDELVVYRLEELRAHLGAKLPTLVELMAYRAENLADQPALDLDASAEALAGWQALAGLLLTQSGGWRKKVSKTDGFPPGKGRAAERKAELLAILDELAAQGDSLLLQSLRQLRLFPGHGDDSEHWEMLSALTRMLPRLGAELLLLFQREGMVDHPQVALAALAALGGDEAPTDIALRLDHRIEHLLVDEFQDTSSLQFELVRRLTRGWAEHNAINPESPRTLLLVGDPMQSIYGFREANVGLFIRARDEGVGDLLLESLELTVNFRSQAGLVSWVNQAFAEAFPEQDEAQRGAVRLRPAGSMRAGSSGPEVALFAGPGAAEAELAALCNRVGDGLADAGVGSMAILGRSRNHLRPVLAALRERGMEAVARDLDPLAQRPLIRDLLTLSMVLANHYDRYAWLSLLRSPAVGLNQADLLHIALQAPVAAALLEDTGAIERLSGLTAEARERMAQLAEVLRWAEHYRDRLALRVWVEECWLRLGGAALLANVADISDAQQFFSLLARREQQRLGFSAAELTDAVETLFASPGDERGKLEVMTLHKAKGLEFDWVFIPSLAKSTANRDQELLLWDEFALPGRDNAFLLDIKAPSHNSTLSRSRDVAAGGRLYDYLKAQTRQKRAFESTRLFYVGCTRAADYLWLGASLGWDDKNARVRAPSSATLLSTIWPSIESSAPAAPLDAGDDELALAPPGLQRVRSLPRTEAVAPDPPTQLEPPVDNRLSRAQGTALHRCLEALHYREALPESVDQSLEALLRVALQECGVDSIALPAQLAAGREALNRCLADPWLRWMLSPQQEQRAAELPLTWAGATQVTALVLDYSFLSRPELPAPGEGGSLARWVVDYKSASPRDGEHYDAFVARQFASYAEQLAAYRDALRSAYPEPVRCALYFTALGRHAEWPCGG